MMDGWWWNGHMAAGGWLLMTLLWIALLAAIVWAVSRIFPARGSGEGGPVEQAEDILDRRLARGEIDPDTYDELRAKLRAARAERERSR